MSQEQETTLELPFQNNLLPLRNYGYLEQDNSGQVNFKSRFVANSAGNSGPRLVRNRDLPNQAEVEIYLEPFGPTVEKQLVKSCGCLLRDQSSF